MTVEEILKKTKNFPIGSNMHDRLHILGNQIEQGKIPLIKTFREWYGIGLKEAKNLSETVCMWRDGRAVTVNETLLDQLAAGKILPDPKEEHKALETILRKGINACFRNWKNLGYDCVQDAIIEFVNRTK